MSIYPAKKALVAVMARVKTLCRQSTNRDRRTLTFSCKQARQTAHRGLIEGSEVQVPSAPLRAPVFRGLRSSSALAPRGLTPK